MRLPHQAVDHAGRWLRLVPGALVGKEVVDEPRGGASQDRMRIGKGVGQVCGDHLVGQVGDEAIEQIAAPGRFAVLAHHGRSHNHSEGIEARGTAIAVGVGQHARSEHAIVMTGLDQVAGRVALGDTHNVAQRIARFRQQEIVDVVAHERAVAKRILIAAREEEVLARLRELGRRVVGHAG